MLLLSSVDFIVVVVVAVVIVFMMHLRLDKPTSTPLADILNHNEGNLLLGRRSRFSRCCNHHPSLPTSCLLQICNRVAGWFLVNATTLDRRLLCHTFGVFYSYSQLLFFCFSSAIKKSTIYYKVKKIHLFPLSGCIKN